MDFMKTLAQGMTRRHFVTQAAAVAGTAALSGAASGAASAAAGQSGGNPESPVAAANACGSDLLQMLVLRTYPVAVKMLRDESEIPRGSVRPKKDLGEHYAAC